jgi:hypothetical protein
MQVQSGPFSLLPEKTAKQLLAASVLNSPGFLNLWRAMKGEATYWIVSDDDDSVMLATGSVSFNRPLMRTVQFGPDGLYFLPLLSPMSEEKAEQAKEILWATACDRYQRVYLTDFSSKMNGLTRGKSVRCETLIASIDSAEWMPPDKKLQSEIRKAEREQLVREPFDLDRHFDRFMKLMFQTESRHGRKPKYNEPFFSALAELAMTEPRLDWTVALDDDRMAASHINLFEGGMLINWQVYYDKQFSSLKPNQYLLIDSIRHGFDRGIRRVNFGATPDEAEGVRVYKEKWGGVPRQYEIMIARRGLGWLR